MRKLLTAFLGLLMLPSAGSGAGAEPELTLAAGMRRGEVAFPTEARTPLIVCVTTPCILAEARTDDGEVNYSLILDVPFSRHWMVEALLTEQDGDHEFRSSFSPILDRATYESTTAQLGLLRHWGEGRLRPFAAGALGVTTFESTALAYDRPFFPGIVPTPVDEEVLSGSFAGGAKVDLGRRLALRLEGRAYWHDLPERLDGTLWQNEASVGLTYRW